MSDNDMMIYRALTFAQDAHDGQVRKFTNREYITHPRRVAMDISMAAGMVEIEPYVRRCLIAAAVLHDTVEDTDITLDDIAGEFGWTVAAYVREVTDPESDENRVTRKAAIRDRYRQATIGARCIKLADMNDNMRDLIGMKGHPDVKLGWVKMYFQEQMALYDALFDFSGFNPFNINVINTNGNQVLEMMLSLARKFATTMRDVAEEYDLIDLLYGDVE